ITIGGNDVGYVPALMAATLPGLVRGFPVIGQSLRSLLDQGPRDQALDRVGTALQTVGETVRAKAPQARVVFVDYLTLLPPEGEPAPPLSTANADLGRHIAARLADITGSAAEAAGCEIVRVANASRDYHAWSAHPWTVGAGFPLLSLLKQQPAPFHPNAAGMRAVADLVVDLVRPAPGPTG
ncbi:MAG: GDSL-type esterase/lipase family protein, partial [Mycobacterium sp.]